MMAEALQPLQRALQPQGQGNASSSSAAPSPPQSRPASPQLNPPPRGAWQNRPERNGQAPRAGNANQPSGPPRTFSQPQGQRGTDSRPRTPPTFQRDQRQFSHALPPCPEVLVSLDRDVLSVAHLDAIQSSMNVTGLCRPTFVVHRPPAATIVLAATTTTHASTPTRAFSHRHRTASVDHQRGTRVGIRARAIGIRRSSARV